MEFLVRLDSVSKKYQMGADLVTAVDQVTLGIASGEFLAIAGSSGSGKTTLLNLLGSLDVPTSGQVFLKNVSFQNLSEKRLAQIRKNSIGFVFQSFNLLPTLTALENVEFPMVKKNLSSSETKSKAVSLLKRVGLERFVDHRPSQLSGGQKQRVAIARALINDPELVLADEPTANLDKKTATEIVKLMRDLNNERQTTFIFSTHDPEIISNAKRVVHISDGKLTAGE